MAASSLLAEIRASKKPYYVYVLSKPDGTPFYVGKGKGNRVFNHEAEARNTQRRSHKLSIIRKILRFGGAVGYSIDSYHNEDADACKREIELIAEIGRLDLGTGPLTNYTSGGDTPEIGPLSRKRRSDSQKRYFANPAARTKTSDATRKFFQEHPEALRANSERKRAYFSVQENRERQSKTILGFFERNPQAGRRHAARVKKWRKQNPAAVAELDRKRFEVLSAADTKKKMSASHKLWAAKHPDLAEVRQQKSIATRNLPSVRLKNAATKKQWNAKNPDKVAAISENLKRHRRIASEIRQRCLSLVKSLSLSAKLPDGRASVDAWKEAEAQLAKEICNGKNAS